MAESRNITNLADAKQFTALLLQRQAVSNYWYLPQKSLHMKIVLRAHGMATTLTAWCVLSVAWES